MCYAETGSLSFQIYTDCIITGRLGNKMSILNEDEAVEWRDTLAKLKKEDKMLLRSTLAHGMYFRRERQWKVFTWSSGIFTVLIAGLLIRGSASSFENPFFPFILSIAATLLVILADERIRHDRIQVGLRADLIAEIDREITAWIGDLELKYQPKEFHIGNRGILWILYVVLMVLIWAAIVYPPLGA